MKNSGYKTNILSLFLDGWRPYAWLAAVGFVLYVQTLFFGLSGYDDTLLITRHYYLIKDITKIPAAFLNDVAWGKSQQFYRPMLTLSFMFNAILGWKSVWFYHLTNVLMHLGSVLLVFWLLKRITGERGLAFVLSLLFAAHPALAPAAAWLPGRNDPLLGLFVFGSLAALIRYREKENLQWYVLHLFLFLGALFTKETSAAIPVVFLVFLLLVYGKQKLKQYIYLIAGWLACLAGYFILRNSVLPRMPPVMNTASENALGLLGYIGKLIFPVNLSVMPMPQDTPWFIGTAALALFIVLFALKGIRGRKIFLAGLFWFGVFLIPTIFRITDFANMLEHRLYVPFLGLLLMVSQAEAVFHFRKTFLTMSAVLFILFSAFAVLHSRDFKDPLSFWQNAVKTSPHCTLAHRSLGMMYMDRKDPVGAAAQFQSGLQYDPQNPGLLNGLALAHVDMGKTGEAIQLLKTAVQAEPNNPFSHDNLGTAWLKAGNMAEAGREYRQAFLLKPDDPMIMLNCSYAHYLLKDIDSASYYYELAVKNGLARDPGIEGRLKGAGRNRKK
ncbi:tetratricopeptide repeat protein [candidate division TA06 bacterium]|uniref:Tetratricopeptide repeat protein n=1 Tax=candidate division TA06 bacterium TaxID=2250710 RepID=A0A933MKH7_UNCT6|nr:tetratricopeptide repeat protein [candidate division TA06 bacterium]